MHEQWLFRPANDEKPFAFARDYYTLRKKPGTSFALGKAIKLTLNSLYGKTAQSVGGSNGKAPVTANPYYAAAITANCRMRLLVAALHSPHDMVMFSTDGIISRKKLKKLPRAKDNDAGESRN